MLDHTEVTKSGASLTAKEEVPDASAKKLQEPPAQVKTLIDPLQGLSFIRGWSNGSGVTNGSNKSSHNGHSGHTKKSARRNSKTKKLQGLEPESLPESDEKPLIKALRGLVANLPDKKARKVFSGRHLKTNDLLNVLEHVAPNERTAFVLKIVAMGLEDRKVFECLRRKLPRIIWFTSNDERVEVLNSLLIQPQGRKVLHLSSLILRQTPDLRTLKGVVSALGVERVLDTKKRTLREFVAHATLGTELAKISLSRALSKYSTRKPVVQRLTEIHQAISERIETLQSHPELKETEIWKRSMRACRKNLQFLGEGRRQRKTTRGLRDLANSLVLMIDLESRFDLIFTNERDKTGQTLKAWSEDELRDVKGVLKQIPKRLLLFTPNLYEVRRVRKEDDDNTAGARHNSGIIQIADCAKNDAVWSQACRGRKSFSSIVAHEIGHGIHLGAYGAQVKVDPKTNLPLYGADPIYEFQDYMRNFGWSVFERKAYTLREGKQVVRLNGRVYKLDVPVTVSGSEVILHYDENDEMLFARKKNAQFSIDPASRSNPWEEWAQDFVEYIDLPTRLIQYDPEKFRYYEGHFRKYHKAPKILALLEQRLSADFTEPGFLATPTVEADRKDVPHKKFPERIYHPEILVTAFQALLVPDQARLLAKLQSETDRANERYIESLSHTFTTWTAPRRKDYFSRLIKGRKDFSGVSALLMQSFERYHPALLAAINAFYNGEEIGILTARADREGHKPILEAVHGFLGFEIKRKNIYFVNDAQKSVRLKEPGAVERKFHILCDFLNGYYIDEHQEKKDLSRRYVKVIYYDACQETLKKLEGLAQRHWHRNDLMLTNSTKMLPGTLWDNLMKKAASKDLAAPHSKRIMRFFELDETLVTL